MVRLSNNIEMVFARSQDLVLISAKARLLPDIYGTGVEPFGPTAASDHFQ